jgi:hypothetical protein
MAGGSLRETDASVLAEVTIETPVFLDIGGTFGHVVAPPVAASFSLNRSGRVASHLKVV